jgi:KDO2-lipid IV(A) lauroyltransferase
MRAVEPLMQHGRTREGMRSVPPDLSGLRAMLRALHSGEAIGILPDQVPGIGEGEWTEFFGRPAYTMTLVTKLAHKTGAPVLLGYAERLARGRGYRLHVVPMPDPLPRENPQRLLNRAIEELVRRCPAQYLWAYNRYKVPSGVEQPVQHEA